jgi:hypothetical protein
MFTSTDEIFQLNTTFQFKDVTGALTNRINFGGSPGMFMELMFNPDEEIWYVVANNLIGDAKNTILYGASNPTTSTGIDGDFYINTSTKTFFGPKNASWPTGTAMVGPKGDTGSQGVKGDTGAAGASGAQGIQGVKGDTGATGPKGADSTVAGPQGVKGDTGATGAKGDTGAIGPQGIQGVKGDTGATGPAGSQGIQGVKGDTGAQGIQGVKGNTGSQGPAGPMGPQGPAGSGGAGAPADIAFSKTIPLTSGTRSFMSPSAVSSAITFTPSTKSVKGSWVYVRLTSNSTNIPAFTGFKRWGTSMEYNTTVGVVNQIQFFYDGYDYWYHITQEYNALPSPSPSALFISGPTTGNVDKSSTVFTVNSDISRVIPIRVTPTPITGVTFVPSSISLPIGSEPATFTILPTTAGTKVIRLTNNKDLSNPLDFNYAAVAASTPLSVPVAPTIGTLTPGNGFVTLEFTRNSNGGSAIIETVATLSTGQVVTGTTSPIKILAPNDIPVTATIRERNSVGWSANSEVSNSATPFIDTTVIQYPRITNLSQANATEVGPAPYDYSTNFAGWLDGPLDIGFVAGYDGWVMCKPNSTADFWLSLVSKDENTESDITFGVGYYGAPFYAPAYTTTRGTGATSGGILKRTAEEYIRVSRVGTTMTYEYSVDGIAWTSLYTWQETQGSFTIRIRAQYLKFQDITSKGLG